MIDCIQSDSLIEIFGKLNKSNTQLRYRYVIFRSFYPIELFQTETVFLVFLFKNK